MRAKITLLLAIACLLVCCAAAYGAADSTLVSFQGKLAGASGAPVPDGAYNMAIKFYDAPTGGTLLLSDSHATAPNRVYVRGGLYTVLLGGGDITAGSETTLWNVFLNHPEVYVGVAVESDPEMSPRIPITRAPYAVRAEDTNKLSGKTASQFLDLGATAQTKTGQLTLDGASSLSPMLAVNNSALNGPGVKSTVNGTNPALTALNKGVGPILRGLGGAGATTVFELMPNGDVNTSGRYTYTTARTSRLTLSPADFVASGDYIYRESPYCIWGLDSYDGGFFLQSMAEQQRQSYHTALHLPDGAVITKLILNMVDTDLAKTSSLFLSKVNVDGTPVPVNIGRLDSGAASHLETAVNTTVDNTNYSYIVTLWLWDATGGQMYFYNAQVEYTYTELKN